ncbi:hypothetical protein FRB90_006967, partial [Tulasnella sp. 427]
METFSSAYGISMLAATSKDPPSLSADMHTVHVPHPTLTLEFPNSDTDGEPAVPRNPRLGPISLCFEDAYLHWAPVDYFTLR